MPFEGIGASVRRKEDSRFLSGRGNYTDDINRPGQLHAYVRRADRPHAKINSIDTSAAAKAPGVVAVFTGADMAADNIGGLPCGWQIHNKDGSPMAEPLRRIWRLCARSSGSSTPSAPLPGPRRCSPISPATPTASPSPTAG